MTKMTDIIYTSHVKKNSYEKYTVPIVTDKNIPKKINREISIKTKEKFYQNILFM